jgi:hypothetical protein
MTSRGGDDGHSFEATIEHIGWIYRNIGRISGGRKHSMEQPMKHSVMEDAQTQ